jgi:arsenic resistance protein ArsH
MSTVDDSLPLVDAALFDRPTGARFSGAGRSTHAPRILML